LYLWELVEALVREGLVVVSDGVADTPAGTGLTPLSLSAAIKRRLSFLSPETSAFLQMAALLGHEFDIAQWCLALGRSETEVTAPLREAAATGVLSDPRQRLSFRHDLVRQMLAEQLPVALRPMLHGHIAQVLAEAGADLDVVAPHLLLG